MSGAKAPPTSVPVDLSKALSSERFARVIDALHNADSKELMYLKLQEWSGRTARMLQVDDSKLQLGYAAKASNAVDRINKPLVGSIYQGIAREEVAEYGQSLGALPRVRKDKDYLDTANAILRASETRKRVREEFPGIEESWTKLFDEDLNPVIQGLPNLIGDPDRRQLFEALAATVSGDVTPELEHVREEIEETHKAFLEGDTQTVGDGLFGITSMLTRTPPPSPPGNEPGDEDENEDPDDEGSAPGNGKGSSKNQSKSKGGASGSAGSGDDEEESEDSGSEDDDSEDEGSDENESEDNSEDEDETSNDEGEDEEDPFEALGQFAKNDDDDEYSPDQINAESQFEPPPDPDDIDMEQVAELDRLKADVGLPKVHDTGAYLYFVTPTPPDAREVYGKTLRLYRSENQQVRNIIDEHYRTAMVIERGLRSGRVDGSRLHRFRTAHSQEVFRRDRMDSVGHLDLVVLVDESGSMTAVDRVEGFRDAPSHLQRRENARGFGGDTGLLLGERSANLEKRRSDTARLMSMFLLDASRHLDGFNVRVAGYSDTSVPGGSALSSVMGAVQKANNKGDHSYYGFNPIVRLLGTQQNPYPITASAPFASNADAQALSYALDHLATSDAPQKAVLYLADGHIYDGQNHMSAMFKKLERLGVYPFFMNLAGEDGHYQSGPLSTIDRQDVASFKDMLDGLKKFLHNLVRQLS